MYLNVPAKMEKKPIKQMSGLSVNPSVFPIFASEPRVREGGYRSRYANLGSFSEVVPGNDRPKTYSFNTLTINGCDTAAKDFVALLCSGTIPHTYPASYLDRTSTSTSNLTVQFEGRATYTVAGPNGAFFRDAITFYSPRNLAAAVDGVTIGISTMGSQSSTVKEAAELIGIQIDSLPLGTVSTGVTEGNDVIWITLGGSLSELVLEGDTDTIGISSDGKIMSTVIEGT
jgi:hypothetical protein